MAALGALLEKPAARCVTEPIIHSENKQPPSNQQSVPLGKRGIRLLHLRSVSAVYLCVMAGRLAPAHTPQRVAQTSHLRFPGGIFRNESGGLEWAGGIPSLRSQPASPAPMFTAAAPPSHVKSPAAKRAISVRSALARCSP